SGGRLRWVMIPPLQSMDKAIEEMRFAKEHGACGILKKGDLEANHWPAEPYFHPLYAEAERLDLPICFHVGTGPPAAMPLDRMPDFPFWHVILPAVHAFQSLISFQTTAQFPGLRWGFVEASASWVPFVLYHMRRILSKGAMRFMSGAEYQINADVLAENHIWV